MLAIIERRYNLGFENDEILAIITKYQARRYFISSSFKEISIRNFTDDSEFYISGAPFGLPCIYLPHRKEIRSSSGINIIKAPESLIQLKNLSKTLNLRYITGILASDKPNNIMEDKMRLTSVKKHTKRPIRFYPIHFLGNKKTSTNKIFNIIEENKNEYTHINTDWIKLNPKKDQYTYYEEIKPYIYKRNEKLIFINARSGLSYYYNIFKTGVFNIHNVIKNTTPEGFEYVEAFEVEKKEDNKIIRGIVRLDNLSIITRLNMGKNRGFKRDHKVVVIYFSIKDTGNFTKGYPLYRLISPKFSHFELGYVGSIDFNIPTKEERRSEKIDLRGYYIQR